VLLDPVLECLTLRSISRHHEPSGGESMVHRGEGVDRDPGLVARLLAHLVDDPAQLGVELVGIQAPRRLGDVHAEVGAALELGHDAQDGDETAQVGAGERPHAPGRGFAGIAERPAEKPLIAAVEGFAVAGGLEVALACDIIVAARGARLGIPEVKRSLVAAGGALLRLPRVLPLNVAMELALTGDPIDAERGHELGLVNRLVDPGQALAQALELADTVAANGPLALAATKRILVESPEWPESDFWARQAEIAGPVVTSEDAREGASAFAEKRAPVWTGR